MARVLSWYAVVVVLLAAVRVAWPAARPEMIGAVGLASIAAIEFGVRRLRPERAGAWRCLQLSLVLLALGDILYLRIEADSPVPVPYPSVPDIATVVGYLLLTVAVFWLGRPTAPEREETSLIDAISLTLAASLIVWITLVRPAVESQADTALYAAKEQGKGRWTEYNPKQWAPRRTTHDGRNGHDAAG